MRKYLAIGIALLAVASLVRIILAADSGQLPKVITFLYAFPNGDKVGHFLLMGCTAFCVALALPRAWKIRGLILLAGAIALEEFSQQFFNHRSSSWLDLGCSLAGVIVFGFLSYKLSQYLQAKREAGQNGS